MEAALAFRLARRWGVRFSVGRRKKCDDDDRWKYGWIGCVKIWLFLLFVKLALDGYLHLGPLFRGCRRGLGIR